jgi:predicted transcriptional regulator
MNNKPNGKIQLSPELEAALKERGVYTSEFIDAALAFALASDEFKQTWLQQELQKGLDQLERGESFSLDEVMDEIANCAAPHYVIQKESF